jgi:hypothetical protein
MMLAASTALSRDAESYRSLRRFMTRLAAALTIIHLVIVVTPLFEWIARYLIEAPPETIGPARLAFALVTPWTWAIADRRFHQGVLIRFGHQTQVGVGTAVRLLGTASVLTFGLLNPHLPGASVAACALTCGVLCELVYARVCFYVLARRDVLAAPVHARLLTTSGLWMFYVPLAMSPLLALLSQPIGAAGMSRMPNAIMSLAVWPVVNGLGFMLRSFGVAFNEVVVRHAAAPNGRPLLRRLAWGLGTGSSVLLLLIAATPLSTWWFGTVTGLPPELVELANGAIWWAVPMPLLSFLHSYYQGLLVDVHRTRGITEAVGVFILVMVGALVVLGIWKPLPGVSAVLLAIDLGSVAQALWLRVRCSMVGADASPAAVVVPAAA